MSRLIDADAFRREIDKHYPFTKEEQSKHGIADMAKSSLLEVLHNMPTIEERKKGEWLPEFDGKFTGGAYWFSCSNCKRIVPEVRNGGWNFCPNCGADMRGE